VKPSVSISVNDDTDVDKHVSVTVDHTDVDNHDSVTFDNLILC